MGKLELTLHLGEEIEDADEETFLLFSQDIPSQNLGFVDPKAQSLTVTVSGRDFTVHQSPGILSSSRAGGTTGAVLWKITPHLANWLASLATDNPLRTALIGPNTFILELGCGISGLTALALGPKVARYVLTDQPYVSRLVAQNLAENLAADANTSASGKKHKRKSSSSAAPDEATSKIVFTPLDWELDSPTASLTGSSSVRSFGVVLACDCIYNDALIKPFVQTCVEACTLREVDDQPGDGAREPCICLVAQQLRSPDVFGSWLREFGRSFRVWRVPDELLSEELKGVAGFVVHLGILKNAAHLE